jgi:hypothetical protein
VQFPLEQLSRLESEDQLHMCCFERDGAKQPAGNFLCPFKA